MRSVRDLSEICLIVRSGPGVPCYAMVTLCLRFLTSRRSRSVSWSLAINQASFDLVTNARHRKHRKDPSISSISFISSLSQQRCRRWQGIHLSTMAQPFTVVAVVASDYGCPQMPPVARLNILNILNILNFDLFPFTIASKRGQLEFQFQACNGNCF